MLAAGTVFAVGGNSGRWVLHGPKAIYPGSQELESTICAEHEQLVEPLVPDQARPVIDFGIHLKSPVFLGLPHQPETTGRPFRVKRSIRRQLSQGKHEIMARLALLIGGKEPKKKGKPEFNAPRAKYEIADRVRAVPYGGLAAITTSFEKSACRT